MIDSTHPGRAILIGAGPGDPELITIRGARLLGEADVVLYDRLVHPDLLERCRPDALRIFVGKRCGRASITQDQINETMLSHARAGHLVVRLKGGDSFVFGRGGEECLALAEAGIPFEVVPGISSAFAVPAYAGIPLTHRNVATSFTVVSGHLHDESAPHDWAALAAAPTLVILMGLRNIEPIVERLLRAGKPADTPAAVIRSGAGPDQTVVRARLDGLADAVLGLEPPAVIVVGPVAALHDRIAWFGAQMAGVAGPGAPS